MGSQLDRAREFAAELARVYGEEARSIVLYGSAAREQFHEGVSDLNVLVLLGRLDTALLHRVAALARGWVEEGNPPPLILTEDELARSLDIFAIEYSDIRDAHRVLHGSDPFAMLEIRPEHLRLQCERELKGALIQLRERYLLVADEPAELDLLLRRSLSTFLVLFRTVLRLEGGAVPQDPEATIRAVAERAGFDPAPVVEVLQARRTGVALEPGPQDPRVVAYLRAVDTVVRYVDRLPAGQ
jgi:predicted nucleotidyltransferase